MHEFSIAVEIGKAVEEILNDKISNLKKIEIKVGKLSGVISDALILALDTVFNAEYHLEDIEIDIEEENASFICNNCGSRTDIDPPLYICSECGSSDGKVDGSTEIIIKSLEVEENG
jgi:hydrogenase nickel incorporation protein HypA/HybF